MSATKTTTATKRATSAKPIAPVVSEALKNIETITKAAATAPKKTEKRDDSRFLAISLNTYVSAISSAAISYKFALQMELSVGLALFAEFGDTDRDAKRALSQVYQQSGYDCEKMDGADYKTVQRRIGAAADLFKFLKKDKIDEWTANTAEMASIQAIAKELEQYNLKGINSVLALVGKPVTLPRDKAKPAAASAPQQAAPTGEAPKQKEPSEGQAKEVAQMLATGIQQTREQVAEEARNRRITDMVGAFNFSTEHVQVVIAPEATKSELIRLSMQLLEFAETLAVAEEADTPAMTH